MVNFNEIENAQRQRANTESSKEKRKKRQTVDKGTVIYSWCLLKNLTIHWFPSVLLHCQ